MKQEYADIRKAMGEPLWFDEVGCPRYAPFHPTLLNDIYADYAVLLVVKCQNCGEEFTVAVSESSVSRTKSGVFAPFLDKSISAGNVFLYGDPPIHRDAAGNTMNTIAVKVVEFWRREGGYREWKRDESLEMMFPVEQPEETQDDTAGR